MSNGYSYNPAGGLDTASDLISVTKKMEELLTTLEGTVRNFIAANEGETPDSYHVAQQEWDAGHAEMQINMGAAINALNEIHEGILRGDRVGTGYF